MPNPQPSYLAGALARFRSAADSALEHGRRAAGQARESGAAFDRETTQLAGKFSRGEIRPRSHRQTPSDLQTAAADYRRSQRLPIPNLQTEPPVDQPVPRPSNDDDDEYFAQQRIMRKL